MASPSKNAKKLLSEELRKLGDEVVDVDDNGDGITRSQKLANLVWKYALGYTDEARDDKGFVKKKDYAPAPWAAQYIFERLEGKVPQAVLDEVKKTTAADKVSNLAKSKINALTKKVLA